jgi:hypothetical protein
MNCRWSFLTHLIWQESRFNPQAVSHAGVQGVAQFMPKTAVWRGLQNPYEPVAAIFKSAELLRDLMKQFGNLGLAAAAYNAGPKRIQDWLERRAGLPQETEAYIQLITGHSADDTEISKLSSPLREENSLKVGGSFRPMTPTEIGSGVHEPQYPVRTSSCRPNLRLIHRTVSKVMTPIDKKSKTGPNIIDHKVELPTIKACPTVFQLPECILSQIGNPISQRTEMTAPIFWHLVIVISY